MRPALKPPPPRGLAYEDAVAVFGEPVIRDAARSRQQLANWRHREGFVPWEYLGPLLLARADRKEVPHSACGLPACPCPNHPTAKGEDTMQEQWRLLSAIRRHYGVRSKQWAMVSLFLETVASGIPDDSAASPPSVDGQQASG